MTKRNIHGRLHYLIWRSDLEMTRLGLALGSIMWALLLFWPGSLFEAYPATYRLMAVIAQENVWAALFALQGAVMIYSLLWGYRSRLSFACDALLGCLLWSSSTACLMVATYQGLTSYQPPAELAYVVVGSAMSWWALVRYSLNTERKSCDGCAEAAAGRD